MDTLNLLETDKMAALGPTLILVYENETQQIPLLIPVTLLGKADHCDVRLDAAEVSDLHCLVSLGPDGVSVRDCASTVGTMVNGLPIRECLLGPTDTLEIGPYRFQLNLPDHWQPPAFGELQVVGERHVSDALSSNEPRASAMEPSQAIDMGVDALERESQRVAELAGEHLGALSSLYERINQQNSSLQGFLREYRESIREQQQEIDTQRQELEALQSRLEQDLAASQAVETNISANLEREELQGALEEARRELEQARAASAELDTLRVQLDQARAALEGVDELRERLAKAEDDVREAAEVIAQFNDTNTGAKGDNAGIADEDLLTLKQSLEQKSQQLAVLLEELDNERQSAKDVFESVRETIQERQQTISNLELENEQLRANIEALQAGGAIALDGSDAGTELAALQARLADKNSECQRLQQRQDEMDVETEKRLSAMRNELDQLRKQMKTMVQEAATQLTAYQKEIAHLRELANEGANGEGGASTEELEKLRSQVDRLTRELRAKSVIPANLTGDDASYYVDLQQYEQQLAEIRMQLEQDQQQFAQLQSSYDSTIGELQRRENAVKQAEIDLAQNRAKIAMEQSLIERLKREAKTDLELLKREAEMLEQTASVRKLRGEIRAQSEEKDDRLSDRIRRMLKRLGDKDA